jgi:hypothetical protein
MQDGLLRQEGTLTIQMVPCLMRLTLVVFETQDLCQLMGINLDAEYGKTCRMKIAIQLLFGCFRRLKTQNILKKHQRKTLGLEVLRAYETHHILHPYKACCVDMMGGTLTV